AVGFVSALSDYRFRNKGLSRWFVSELSEALGSTVHDVRLILDFLAQRGDIDMNRVGMFGLGSGGTIRILAAHADARIRALDGLDPWGDWPEWVGNTALMSPQERAKYNNPQFLLSVSNLDPLACFPGWKPPSFRLQQMLNEPVTPPAAKERMSTAAPPSTTLVKYQTAQDLYKAWQTAGLSGWIKQQMRPQTLKETDDEHHVAKN